MASCVKNIPTKNYQNLVIGFQVTVENVGDVFWDIAVYYYYMILEKQFLTWRQVWLCACKLRLFMRPS